MSVPATIMTSDWRGDARKTMPKRSMSYLDVAECIISTAQQANPKVMGQSEPLRAQFTNSSTFVTMNSTFIFRRGLEEVVDGFRLLEGRGQEPRLRRAGAAARAGRMAARAGGAAARAPRANAARSIYWCPRWCSSIALPPRAARRRLSGNPRRERWPSSEMPSGAGKPCAAAFSAVLLSQGIMASVSRRCRADVIRVVMAPPKPSPSRRRRRRKETGPRRPRAPADDAAARYKNQFTENMITRGARWV